MTCYKPLKGYFSRKKNANGKRDILFGNFNEAFTDMPVEVPCGRCIGCRLENSRQWAVRCVHESKLSPYNCFLTLTYNDEHLPANGTLVKSDVQNFIKRLRKKYPLKKISYLYCGEYGEDLSRPHYHICLFGMDFYHDRKYYKSNSLGNKLYNSETLDKLWSKSLKEGDRPTKIGHAVIGELTFQSAAYVARYVTKKVIGEDKSAHYGEKVDIITGEISYIREPEFAEASRRPALGRRWFEKNYKEVYPNDFVVINKVPQKPPKYYDNLLENVDKELYFKVKSVRTNNMKQSVRKNPLERSRERLEVKEQIRERKKQHLPRSIE